MRQWSDLLLREILGWPNVSSRPMFGMTAVYRGKAIRLTAKAGETR